MASPVSLPRTSFLLLLILTLVTAFAVFFARQESTAPPSPLQTESNYFLQDFQLKTFNEKGRLEQIIGGQLLRQRSSDQEHELISPQLTMYSDGAVWLLSASNGWMDADLSQARLEKNVVLSNDTTPYFQLKTEALEVDVPNRFVTSRDKVTIEQGRNHLEGARLEAHLDTQIIRLKPEVRGVYVP